MAALAVTQTSRQPPSSRAKTASGTIISCVSMIDATCGSSFDPGFQFSDWIVTLRQRSTMRLPLLRQVAQETVHEAARLSRECDDAVGFECRPASNCLHGSTSGIERNGNSDGGSMPRCRRKPKRMVGHPIAAAKDRLALFPRSPEGTRAAPADFSTPTPLAGTLSLP